MKLRSILSLPILLSVCLSSLSAQLSPVSSQTLSVTGPNIGDGNQHTTSLVTTLPSEARTSIVAALGRHDPKFWLKRTSHGFEARNFSSDLRTSFRWDGVRLQYRNLTWGIAFEGYGRGDDIHSCSRAVLHAKQNRIEYHRGALTEWYVNSPAGLEQGFTIAGPADGPTDHPVSLIFKVSGNAQGSVHKDGKGLTLTVPQGGTLRYAGLKAHDATGKPLMAWLDLQGSVLRLNVADQGARYPVTVDPIVEVAELTESVAQDALYFGSSVAMNEDTIVVGAPYYEGGTNYAEGAAYVFVKPSTGWADMTETARLLGTNLSGYSLFGSSVSICGQTIVVGVPGNHAAYVYTMPTGGWVDTYETAKLTTNRSTNDRFAYSIAISKDTVVVGADYATVQNQYQGAAYVFVKPRGGWVDMTETAQLTSSDGSYEDEFGSSVAIDGKTIAVGAIQPLSSPGKAYVFLQPYGGWRDMTQTAELTASDGAGDDHFGTSVAIDHDTVAVTAPLARLVTGSVYVFVRQPQGWGNMTETAELQAQGSTNLGNSVAIKGSRIAVGSAYFNYVNNGFVYIYERPKQGWRSTSTYKDVLTIVDGHGDEGFGSSVALTDDTVVGGAPTAVVGYNYYRGKVAVFQNSGN